MIKQSTKIGETLKFPNTVAEKIQMKQYSQIFERLKIPGSRKKKKIEQNSKIGKRFKFPNCRINKD